MHAEIIVAGFGGQGILFAGQLLAYAGLAEGRHVTWIPSYGPEMRGGTAHCTVILSDQAIGSPLVEHPTAVLACNTPSCDRFAAQVRPGGLLIRDSVLVPGGSGRADIDEIAVPANEIAAALGVPQAVTVVLLGALIAATGVVTLETMDRVLADHLRGRHVETLAANREALARGAALVHAPVVAVPVVQAVAG
jgi:2-oxoglutarate ferredoxin oxidoreductase subunit gamma